MLDLGKNLRIEWSKIGLKLNSQPRSGPDLVALEMDSIWERPTLNFLIKFSVKEKKTEDYALTRV